MTSNSKLTPEQNAERKELKFAAFAQGIALAHNGKTTIAFKHKGNTVELALSVASPDEVKFRRKVGEFFALCKFFDGATITMSKWDFDYMLDYMELYSKQERKDNQL